MTLPKVTKEQVDKAVDDARKRGPMSKEEREEQLINFVWGNDLEGEERTLDDVRKSLGR